MDSCLHSHPGILSLSSYWDGILAGELVWPQFHPEITDRNSPESLSVDVHVIAGITTTWKTTQMPRILRLVPCAVFWCRLWIPRTSLAPVLYFFYLVLNGAGWVGLSQSRWTVAWTGFILT